MSHEKNEEGQSDGSSGTTQPPDGDHDTHDREDD